MRSGWIAPAGPELQAFEQAIADYLGVQAAVALTSGTAAIHLGLKYLGVREGDLVLVPSATFAATAFAVTYLGAHPVFIDSEPTSWNIDPSLIESAVVTLRQRGQRVAAAIPVDLYGTPANYGVVSPLLEELGVPMLEDAAEGLGASFACQRLGSIGQAGAISFNGNKIITSSGGGMLVTNDIDMADRIRFWSTQSREEFPWYEHREVGYNYRMSNLLAALGRSQLKRIDEEVSARRTIRDEYRRLLEPVEGISVQQDPIWGKSNAWLSVLKFDTRLHPNAPSRVRKHLSDHMVESRPVWKPLHQQPVFNAEYKFLNGTSDELFRDGLCLPSSSSLGVEDVARISSMIIECLAEK
jgi:dTDP-4-amino-4,6-dideoxygalactose transaminase